MTRPAPKTVLHLVEEFDLRRGGESIRVPEPARKLLAYLALQSRPVQRRTVARTLWVDRDDSQAAARLRSTLWRLPSPDGISLVDSVGGRLALGDAIDVDVRAAEAAEEDARPVGPYVHALSGDVLADWTDEWVVVERERFRQVRLHRLDQLAEQARLDRSFGTALRCAQAAVAAEPLRESSHRQVILVHLAEHNPSEALRQFELVRRLLRDELGLAPSPTTRALVADLLGRPLDSQGARAAS